MLTRRGSACCTALRYAREAAAGVTSGSSPVCGDVAGAPSFDSDRRVGDVAVWDGRPAPVPTCESPVPLAPVPRSAGMRMAALSDANENTSRCRPDRPRLYIGAMHPGSYRYASDIVLSRIRRAVLSGKRWILDACGRPPGQLPSLAIRARKEAVHSSTVLRPRKRRAAAVPGRCRPVREDGSAGVGVRPGGHHGTGHAAARPRSHTRCTWDKTYNRL